LLAVYEQKHGQVVNSCGGLEYNNGNGQAGLTVNTIINGNTNNMKKCM
jgi:hypothetical protein